MKSRWLFVATAVISAALLAISVWVGNWWTIGGLEIGPFGAHECFSGDCRPTSISGAPELWQRCGTAVWAGGMLSMILLLGIAAALAARRVPKMLAKSSLTAIATTALAGAYFIVKLPAPAGMTVGQGVYLFVAAVVLAFVTPIRVLRS
ncbi:MAG TPA: hypothetical protein VFQ65_28900 [Kofleriaceae bacterium]|nr:hypothetical protein [Kofleriaceae bacterium]